MPRSTPHPETFWARVRPATAPDAAPTAPHLHGPPTGYPNLHWFWDGSVPADGRPRVWRHGRLMVATRYAYELVHGRLLATHEQLRRRSNCTYENCVNVLEHLTVYDASPTRPLHMRRSKLARAFRDELAQAQLEAFRTGVGWYCLRGHPLKQGVARKNCPDCRRERVHAHATERLEEIRSAPLTYLEEPASDAGSLIELPDLSGLMSEI